MRLHGLSDVRYVSAVQSTWWRPGPQPEEPIEVLRALARELLAERDRPGDPNWRDISQQFQLDIANPEKSGVLLASAHESRAALDAARGSATRERGRPELPGWALAGALACYGALFFARPAAGTGVALAGTAVLAVVLGARLAWRARQRAARRSAVAVAGRNWREALRDGVLASYLDRLASSLSQERFKLVIGSSAASATGHGRDPEVAVETAAMQSVATVARHIGKGSIGISGPRGAGKSTILAKFGIRAEVTQPGRQSARDLRMHVAAPVDYDAREFLVHLFLELCAQVRAGSPPVLLAAETRRHQDRLRFLRSYASTWGPAAVPWTALSVPWTLARTRSEQAEGLPAIVGQFREYSERVADWKRRDGCRVIICIDEMDKIRDSDRAESFLNEIKAIFDVPGCLYLVAISEDAMTVFASRTPAIRTAFDSAFDEIISVQPMTFTEARDMLDLRFIGVPWPFLALCHVLAGGVPRDLLRAARALIQAVGAPGADVRDLPEVTGALVRTRCDVMREEAILQLSRSGAPGTILLPLHGADWPGRAPGGIRAAVLDAADLRKSADELAASARGLRNDEWQQMCADVSVALRFYAMVIEVFGRAPARVWGDIKDERYGLIDDLARARHTMRTNSGLAEDLLDQFRRDYLISGTRVASAMSGGGSGGI
jgi:hypothetical protein